MTDDLVTFLRTCLDDEQREAEDALKRTTTTRRRIGGQWVEDAIQPPEWRRSAWPPARVLREIEAKRDLLNRYVAMSSDVLVVTGVESILSEYRRVILPQLALPYADHPDYREDWRP